MSFEAMFLEGLRWWIFQDLGDGGSLFLWVFQDSELTHHATQPVLQQEWSLFFSFCLHSQPTLFMSLSYTNRYKDITVPFTNELLSLYLV